GAGMTQPYDSAGEPEGADDAPRPTPGPSRAQPTTQPLPVIPAGRTSAARRVRARWARRLPSGPTVTSVPKALEPLVRAPRTPHAKADVAVLSQIGRASSRE